MSLSVKVLEREAGLTPDAADRTAALLYTLIDLYALKPSHSPDEELQFIELSIRLIDAVDGPTRIVVAQRLEAYGRAPQAVLRHLASARPAATEAGPALHIAEPAAIHEASTPIVPEPVVEFTEPAFEQQVDSPVASESSPDGEVAPAVPDYEISAEDAAELIEIFFTADSAQRTLILHNLDFAPIAPAEPLHEVHASEAARRLEVAALARNPYEFATILVGTLGITQTLAVRIAQDPSGEPLIVAARALGLPSEILQRIVLFLNPAVGESVQRVYDLVRLHDEIAPDTARRMLSIWRVAAARMPRHQPHYHDDETRRARAEAGLRAHPPAPRIERARRGGVA